VHFQTEHRFHGTSDRVADAMCDPEFYLTLALPDLSKPLIIEQKTSGDSTTLRLRYEFVGSLDPIAKRLLGSQRLGWVQELRMDSSRRSGTLSFEAQKDPKKLHGDARFVLEEEGAETLRRLEGDLVVAVIGIGPMAERKIVPGLLRRLDVEASALDEKLRSGT
jgi:Protein of unknown function (DUF2505)